MTTNAPSGPATIPHGQLPLSASLVPHGQLPLSASLIPHGQLPSSASLIPIDLKVAEERQILYDQRIICGWNHDKIPKWAAAIENGTRSFFWICLGPDAEKDIPIFTRDGTRYMPVGHVSLDKVDINEPDAVPDTTLADPDKGVLTITSLFVLPAFHRSGLGAFAMDECERLARVSPFGSESIVAVTVNTLSPRYCVGGVEGPGGLGQWEREAADRPVPQNNMLWYEKKGYKRYKEAPRYTSVGKQGETLWCHPSSNGLKLAFPMSLVMSPELSRHCILKGQTPKEDAGVSTSAGACLPTASTELALDELAALKIWCIGSLRFSDDENGYGRCEES